MRILMGRQYGHLLRTHRNNWRVSSRNARKRSMHAVMAERPARNSIYKVGENSVKRKLLTEILESHSFRKMVHISVGQFIEWISHTTW